MGLFDNLFSDDSKKRTSSFGLFSFLEEQTKKDELEKEMDNYGLEDWQKELVRNGEYNSWNFEEEELEEDDFYSEDEN